MIGVEADGGTSVTLAVQASVVCALKLHSQSRRVEGLERESAGGVSRHRNRPDQLPENDPRFHARCRNGMVGGVDHHARNVVAPNELERGQGELRDVAGNVGVLDVRERYAFRGVVGPWSGDGEKRWRRVPGEHVRGDRAGQDQGASKRPSRSLEAPKARPAWVVTDHNPGTGDRLAGPPLANRPIQLGPPV